MPRQLGLFDDNTGDNPSGQMETGYVRLCCRGCDLAYDMISGAELRKLQTFGGWTEIVHLRLTFEAMDAGYEAGFDDWCTHQGVCPDCRADNEKPVSW